MPRIALPNTPRTIEVPLDCQKACQEFLDEFGPILKPAEPGSWKRGIYDEISLLAGVE